MDAMGATEEDCTTNTKNKKRKQKKKKKKRKKEEKATSRKREKEKYRELEKKLGKREIRLLLGSFLPDSKTPTQI